MTLREANAEIHSRNQLVMDCVGDHRCGHRLVIPFKPGIGGAPDGTPLDNGFILKRTSGETIDDITLIDSVNAYECGHFFVTDGKVVMSE